MFSGSLLALHIDTFICAFFATHNPNINIFLVVVLLGDRIHIVVYVFSLNSILCFLLCAKFYCLLITYLLGSIEYRRLNIFGFLTNGSNIECLYFVVWRHFLRKAFHARQVPCTIIYRLEIRANFVSNFANHFLSKINKLPCSIFNLHRCKLDTYHK